MGTDRINKKARMLSGGVVIGQEMRGTGDRGERYMKESKIRSLYDWEDMRWLAGRKMCVAMKRRSEPVGAWLKQWMYEAVGCCCIWSKKERSTEYL